MTDRRWLARGGRPGGCSTCRWAVPFGIIGGRIYHVLTTPQPYFGEGGDPLKAFAIWEGGLGIWGGIAFGGVGAWIACRRGAPAARLRRRRRPGPAAGAGHRPAGQLVQQRAVRPGDRPAVGPADRRVGAGRPTADGADRLRTYHPTFLYELLWNLGVAARGDLGRPPFKLSHGRAFALYVRSTAWAGCGSSAAHRRGQRSSASGSTCSPGHRRSAGVAYLVWQRGRPREVITRGGTPRGRPRPGRPLRQPTAGDRPARVGAVRMITGPAAPG